MEDLPYWTEPSRRHILLRHGHRALGTLCVDAWNVRNVLRHLQGKASNTVA